MAKQKKPSKTYRDACLLAAKLDVEGASRYAIAQALMKGRYPTAKGGRRWYRGTAATAATLGAMADPPAAETEDRGDPKPALEPASETASVDAKPAPKPAPKPRPEPKPADATGNVTIMPGTRRPLKRMLSKEQWESMPAEVRKAVVAELADRLLAGGER